MSGKIVYQETTHIINGNMIEFQRMNPTVGDPSTHRITIGAPGAETVAVEFDAYGFQLLKDILSNY